MSKQTELYVMIDVFYFYKKKIQWLYGQMLRIKMDNMIAAQK